jgi:D-alanyl-D-alanine carboxypeptidase/D-alanyl-D-alanine-endopeptidase (penicillin-binding protein 4)
MRRSLAPLGMTAVVLLLLLAPAAHAQSLARRLDARLDAPPFDRQLWGIAVVDEQGHLLYGRNDRRLFTPASNAKILVAAVASALLPPDWTVRTSVYAGGPLSGGILHGDLILYGRGDPTFSRRCFAVDTTRIGACDRSPLTRLTELAEVLRARGIREVHGDVVGDGSYFEPATVNPSWEVFDLNWWYAAPVSALAFNDNSIDFLWRPGAAVGTPALITMSPDFGDVAFENRTLTVPVGGVSDIGDRFYRVPGTLQVWAEGTAALDHPPVTESLGEPGPHV